MYTPHWLALYACPVVPAQTHEHTKTPKVCTAWGTTFPVTWSPHPRHANAVQQFAAEADHAMVCEKVAKMTQMRHDNLANALRLVASACSCQWAAASLQGPGRQEGHG